MSRDPEQLARETLLVAEPIRYTHERAAYDLARELIRIHRSDAGIGVPLGHVVDTVDRLSDELDALLLTARIPAPESPAPLELAEPIEPLTWPQRAAVAALEAVKGLFPGTNSENARTLAEWILRGGDAAPDDDEDAFPGRAVETLVIDQQGDVWSLEAGGWCLLEPVDDDHARNLMWETLSAKWGPVLKLRSFEVPTP